MKKYFTAIIASLCFIHMGNAQFLKKLGKKAEKAAERVVERRVEKKTTEKTEMILDSTLEKKSNKKTKTGGSISNVTSSRYYQFKHLAQMQLTSGKDIINIDYHLPKNEAFFGMIIKDEKIDDDMIIIYDVALETMATYISNGGQKIKMSIDFKTDDEETNALVYDIKKTGNTKVISGYNCEEYKMTGEDIEATIWVTKDVEIRFPSTLYSNNKRKSSNQAWLKDLDGWAMEMTLVDTSRKKAQITHMKCLAIETSNLKINSNEYQSIGGY